jgi:sterol carrier protein 2
VIVVVGRDHGVIICDYPRMADPVRPPKDITPSKFFTEWLPAQVPAGAGGGGAGLTIRVQLSGDEGGAWDLKLGGSGLNVSAPDGATADVTVAQTVQDWKAIAVGEAGAVNLAPAQASPTDILFLDKASQTIAKSVKGTMRFEVTGYNGRTWSLTVKFGPGVVVEDKPDATISVDAETYGAMLARTLPAPQAYFQGKVKIAGDVNLAMQLGMAMMPRFS